MLPGIPTCRPTLRRWAICSECSISITRTLPRTERPSESSPQTRVDVACRSGLCALAGTAFCFYGEFFHVRVTGETRVEDRSTRFAADGFADRGGDSCRRKGKASLAVRRIRE